MLAITRVFRLYAARNDTEATSPRTKSVRPCVAIATIWACIGLGTAPVFALDPILHYAVEFAGTGQDSVEGLAVDGSDNLYCAGLFGDTVDFDPGPGVNSATSNGGNDVFLTKFDETGNLLWAKTFGGTGKDRALSATTDGAGNVYITGTFEGTVDFDPGVGTAFRTSVGPSDVFVARFSPSGDLDWVSSVGGSSTQAPNDIAVDATGATYTIGYFSGTVDFDPSAAIQNRNSAGDEDVFLLKLDAMGAFVWVGRFGLGDDDRGEGVDVDAAGNVYITGTYRGDVDFDPSPAVEPRGITTGQAAFVCKFDTNRVFEWSVDAGRGSGAAIALDGVGNVYVGGAFLDPAAVDFDPGPAVYSLIPVGGNRDHFVWKLTGDGDFVWVSPLASATSHNSIDDMVVDSAGAVYATGQLIYSGDFDPSGATYTLTAQGGVGYRDGYIWKLNAVGGFEWARQVGGLAVDYGTAVAVDSSSNVYAGGHFSAVIEAGVEIESGTGPVYLNGAAGGDAYLFKLEPQYLPIAGSDIGETDANIVLSSLVSPAGNNILANDSDANTIATLAITAFDAVSSLGAIVVVNPDGTFSYDPTAVPALLALGAGDSLVDSFTYTLSDGTNAVTGTVTITVFGAGTNLSALSYLGMGVLVFLFAAIIAFATIQPPQSKPTT